jgi:hypothetical protein
MHIGRIFPGKWENVFTLGTLLSLGCDTLSQRNYCGSTPGTSYAKVSLFGFLMENDLFVKAKTG